VEWRQHVVSNNHYSGDGDKGVHSVATPIPYQPAQLSLSAATMDDTAGRPEHLFEDRSLFSILKNISNSIYSANGDQ
jgi:hypothetical protein